MATWAGQYKRSRRASVLHRLKARATASPRGFLARRTALPPSGTAHPELPRTWAWARVDALLDKIAREGEDRAAIDEIIRLSKKYKFVTTVHQLPGGAARIVAAARASGRAIRCCA